MLPEITGDTGCAQLQVYAMGKAAQALPQDCSGKRGVSSRSLAWLAADAWDGQHRLGDCAREAGCKHGL